MACFLTLSVFRFHFLRLVLLLLLKTLFQYAKLRYLPKVDVIFIPSAGDRYIYSRVHNTHFFCHAEIYHPARENRTVAL